MKKSDPLTIGGLAKSANVGVETIRFYERKQLIKQPAKTGSFRHYSDEDVRIVLLVKKLQGVGFSLDEVKAFLEFDKDCGQSTQLIKQKSLSKIVEIEQKITDLQATVEALQTFANACGSKNCCAVGCDLLVCFENQWRCCNQMHESTTGEDK
jgi:MerR family mercuric resistance operon transcriptional regulator